jgi:hypothetical protein
MNTVFSDLINAHYGQAHVHLQGGDYEVAYAWEDQTNGLLGVAEKNLLLLMFGLHTGMVHLSVKVSREEPELDNSWEEIVEASFTMPEEQALGLRDWGGTFWQPIPLKPGPHRVRYSARHFKEGEELSMGDSSTHPTEEYELVFWPSPSRADQIIKVTKRAAQYWHDAAQGKA